ncbi:unnamed protein product [Ascophyllum nodosum]
MKGSVYLIPMLLLPCVCPRSVVAFLISWPPRVEHRPSRASSLARCRTVGTEGAFGQRSHAMRARDSWGSVLLMREEGCMLDRRTMVKINIVSKTLTVFIDTVSALHARRLHLTINVQRPRQLIRAVGAALASATASSATLDFPREDNASAAASPSVPRRPSSKRSPKPLCDDAVSYLRNPTKQSEVWIVGTAHISNSSAELVGSVIREIKPQVVMLELDIQRVGAFLDKVEEVGDDEGVDSDEEKPRVSSPDKKRKLLDPNISVSDRVTDFFAAALGSAISNMYRTLDQKGLSSGQEFTVALREAGNCGAKILLGDRNVKLTLRRLSEALRSTNLKELTRAGADELGLGLEALDVGSAESISANLEQMKRRDTMRKVTDFYRREAPELYSAMIGERDEVMAVKLMNLEDKQTTVAVVGLAHVDGIEAILTANGWNIERC